MEFVGAGGVGPIEGTVFAHLLCARTPSGNV